MRKSDSCIICGRKLRIFKAENINSKDLTVYTYSSRKMPEYMHYALYECRNCRVLYSDYTAEIQDIFKNYREAGYDNSGGEANDASRTYYKYFRKKLPYYHPKRVLDIGTGNGSFLEILKNDGMDVVGVEPSEKPVMQAVPEIREKIIRDVFRGGMFERESFDMISLFQTIEHIPDTENTLKEIYSILKEGGCFYLICHDYRSLVNRLLGEKSPIYDIEHLQIFSKRSLYRMLKKIGYREIKMFTTWNKYPLSYWVKMFPFNHKVKEKLLDRLNHSAIGQIGISINVGNIGVIAKK